MTVSIDELRQLAELYDQWQAADALPADVAVPERDRLCQVAASHGPHFSNAFEAMVRTAGTAETADTDNTLPPHLDALRDAAAATTRVDLSDRSAMKTAAELPSNPPPERQPGQHVGPYRLIREIGRGGMGVVWLAARADGQHERQVALKMPLVENLNWLLAARFSRERNILASLEHPGIARLYDAGVDEANRNAQPYIAIEYVQGQPITTYVKEKRLQPEAIVQLFIRVIEAVAHAHAQLVIHRDIKPANILVDAKGEPHLLDFGIAKLLEDEYSDSVDATQLTRLSGRALTLDYASPEQVNNAPLGVASDIYALGVVLYELLTGSRPYHPKGPTRRDLELAILEQEPTKPSDHLLSTGDSESGKSARRMRGDLDTIVLKALRKDAKLRYASAQAFADDLKRYLSYQPIQARPDGTLYRITKFIRRQRVPLGIAVVSCAAIAGLSWRAWQQQQVAQASVARAESIDGLMRSIFQGMSPDTAATRNFSAKELLDRAQVFLTSDVSVDATSRRAGNVRMAELYAEVGAYPDAALSFERERTLAHNAGEFRAEAMALWNLSDVFIKARELDKAEDAILRMSKLLGQSIRRPDEMHARKMIASAQLANYRQQSATALSEYRAAEDELRAARSTDFGLLAWAIQGQGYAAREQGDLTLARERLLTALPLYDRAKAGAPSVDRLLTTAHLGSLENWAGNFSAAHKLFLPLVPELKARLGARHPHTLGALRSLAYASMRTGQFEQSASALKQLIDVEEPFRAAEASYAQLLRAMMLMYGGDAVGAEPQIRELLQAEIKTAAAGAASVERLRRVHGECLLRMNAAGALSTLQLAEANLVATLGSAHADVAIVRALTTTAHFRAGNIPAARATLTQALPVLKRERGEAYPATLVLMAYDLLLSRLAGEAPAPADAESLAVRIEAELGWQHGARDLAQWLRRPAATANLKMLPIVF